MKHAAGVMICSTEGRVLLLQRSEMGDLPGLWCIPGGMLQSGEDCLDAAIRETAEETGFKPSRTRCEKWTQRIANDNGVDPVDFTTYCLRDVKEFTPTICPEHVAFCWCDPAHPPMGLHPGCVVSLQKLSPTWNELHVAKAVREGQLTSPQRYENITFFDVRVTGTGEAYRSMKKDESGNVLYDEEYVWRDPAIYLNEEFLERVNGVPVILEHPDTSTLTTEEYRTRTIGALTLPYIKGEEVWAIARVQDDAAAKIMSEEQLSTSPAVSWSDPDANVAGKLKDGSNFLIEGKPTLLDHLAICWQGVWDKDGGPSGINIARGDSMTTEVDLKKLMDQNDAITRALAGMTNGFETLNKRLDSVESNFEKHRREAAQMRIDSFKFSKRKPDESERVYQSRHDDEERVLRADLMRVATGEDKEKAHDAARKARRDAEEKEEKEKEEEERRDKRKDQITTKPSIMSKKDEDKDKDKDRDDSKRDDDDDDDKRKDAIPPQFKKDDDDDDKRKDDDDDKRKDDDDDKRKDDDDDKRKDAKSAKDDDDDKRKDDKRKDRKDSASAAAVAELKKQVERLSAGMKPLSDDDLVKVGKLSKRCDSIYVALGESMPRLMPGESLVDYHRKLAADLKKHTKYKDSELAVIAADSNTFDVVTEDIFKQAEEFAKSPARYKPGELVQRVERMDSGHTRYTYEGSSNVWMRQFAGPVQNHAKKWLTREEK